MERTKATLLMILVGLTFVLGNLVSIPMNAGISGTGQAIGHGGAFVVQHVRNGDVIWQSEKPNYLMYMGGNATIDLLTGSGGAAFNYIAVSNTTTPLSSSTTLADEATALGLARAIGTVARAIDSDILNVSVNKVFTYTGTSACIVNTTAIFNASSAGSMFIGSNFTSRTLETNDQINITAYYWVA